MKRTMAVMAVVLLALVILSACRAPGEDGEDGAAEAGRRSYAMAWCEDHKAEFSHAALYAQNAACWFGPYPSGGDVLMVTQDHNAYYYEDDTGSRPVEEIAGILVAAAEAAGEAISPVPPMDWEGIKAQLAQAAVSNAADEEEVTQLLEARRTYPALGESMWVCGYPPDCDADAGWFVIIKSGGAYVLCYDGVLPDFARLPEVQVCLNFGKAVQAFGWFHSATLPSTEERRTLEGEPRDYYRVDSDFKTLEDLRAYLTGLFSEAVIDELLDTGIYREFDGALYVYPLDYGTRAIRDGTVQIRRESPARIIYCIEGDLRSPDDGPSEEPNIVQLEFPYEHIGDAWVFTEFDWPV